MPESIDEAWKEAANEIMEAMKYMLEL